MIEALKNLTKDTFTYGFASILGQIIGFLLLPLYTTYLTTQDYGVMAMITFISMFFAPLANMGVTNAIFRRFNLHKDERLQITSLSIGTIFVFASSLIWLILGFILSNSITRLLVDDIVYLHLIQISLITAFFVSVGQVFTVVLRARRKVTQIAAVRIAELLITVGFTIYFVVVLKLKVEGVVKGALIGGISGFLLQYLLCFQMIKLRFDFNELKELLKYGIPFLPHRLIAYGSIFLSQFFIKEFIGLTETGLYNIALRFSLPLTFVINSVQSAWVPIKFQIHREEGANSTLVFRRLISFYFVVILLIFSLCVSIGPELIRLMTTLEYHKAIKYLPVALLVPFAKAIYFMAGTGFEFTNDTRPMPIISGSGLIILFVVASFSHEKFGVYGIIIALIASWLTMAIIMRYFAVKRFYVPINFKLITTLFIMAILTGTIVFLLQVLSSPVRITSEVLTVLMSVTVFVVLLIYLDDLKALDVKKYPMFSKLNKILIPLAKYIKK